MANRFADIQPTESAAPERRETIEIESKRNDGIRVVMLVSSDKIKHWSVIVETWSHKNYGRGKRGYLQTFNQEERAVISRYHGKLYGWMMRTGFPNEIELTGKTWGIMDRAANFFASI